MDGSIRIGLIPQETAPIPISHFVYGLCNFASLFSLGRACAPRPLRASDGSTKIWLNNEVTLSRDPYCLAWHL